MNETIEIIKKQTLTVLLCTEHFLELKPTPSWQGHVDPFAELIIHELIDFEVAHFPKRTFKVSKTFEVIVTPSLAKFEPIRQDE